MSHAIEQRGQRLDPEVAAVKPAAARGKDIESARVAADERAQQLVVETPWRTDDLVELKLGRNVEVVAHVARLEIKIHERDPDVLCRLVPDQMDGGFDCKRRIADSPRTGHKRDNDRRLICVVVSRGRADAPYNFENFLLKSSVGHPVSVSGLNESLVVAGRNIAADDNEEYVS
jgi:hypothetical protein